MKFSRQEMPATVQARYSEAPTHFEEQLLTLRELIFDVIESENIDFLEETLKRGEPSYLAQQGSTLRISWSDEHYGLYFHCQSQLVETFKRVYGDVFQYSGNRAIVFTQDDDIPTEALKQCIAATLRYHHVKQLSHLGILS